MKSKLEELLIKTKKAAAELSQLNTASKNEALERMAEAIQKSHLEILSANKNDLENARKDGLSEAFINRLTITNKTLEELVEGIRGVIKLEDPIGKVLEEKTIENGAVLKKLSVSLGIIGIIFESRPDVLVDVIALGLKSGDGLVLKGGSEAINSNRALYKIICEALVEAGINKDAFLFLDSTKRSVVSEMLKQNRYIDVIIPRGGYSLVKTVTKNSKIPVLYHAEGGARIYVDKSADLKMAKVVIINAKTNRPATCNSLDTLVIHQDVAKNFLMEIYGDLNSRGVEVRGDTQTRGIIKVVVAKETDWKTEYLDKILAVKIVSSAEAAVDFIQKYSKKHSEGVIAKDQRVIDLFTSTIDASALFVNCSTRLHDGYIFGMGAEMGIATGKLHARGPVGLKELTTYKWVLYGTGQVRT